MSTVPPVVTDEEAITKVQPLERSTENELPAPVEVTDDSKVFFESVRSMMIYSYVVIKKTY
uniref:Uncharacterized protein n=1 Tax=uncultured marine virus TaxID=186617 RepID=A0A0F7LBJ8_9VIRU|nr:hypothetical protein [uncultured marine virus]